MNSDDFLGPYQDSPSEGDQKQLFLTQCHCDNCSNSFFVEGSSVEFLPKFCAYCGSAFGEVEEDDNFDDHQWGGELFS